MNNKRGIFKIQIVLNYQWVNLNLDILVLIFGCHLAEIWMLKSDKRFKNFRKWGKMVYQCEWGTRHDKHYTW